MNKIKYIMHGDRGITLGFDSAADAESFIASQSANLEWQAAWKIERIFAYNKFHWIAHTNDTVTLHFNQP